MDNSPGRDERSPTVGQVEWEHLFDDLEGQLAAEWEAERAALDAESERLRISRLALRERLRILASSDARAMVALASGDRLTARVSGLGADWVGLTPADDPRLILVPIDAIEQFGVDHGTLLASLDAEQPAASLRERMTLGFVLRDLARRRVPIRMSLRQGDPLHGTIDRAGADHLDLAVHDPGEPRRTHTVRAHLMVPFAAIVWVRAEWADAGMP